MPVIPLIPPFTPWAVGPISPLVLADRMLTLAQQAERAGLADTAGRLVTLALTVFDEPVQFS
jgi:hypothetical protein